MLFFGAKISVQRHAVGNGLSHHTVELWGRGSGHLCCYVLIAMRLAQSGAGVIQL
jgi:hypothetical protein